MRPIFTAAAAALMTLVALPTLASPAAPRATQAQAANMCRSTCAAEAMSRPGGATQQALAACTVRCAAAASFVAQQNRSGTAEATGRGRTAAPLAAPQPAAPVARPVSMNTAAPANAARQSVGVIYTGRAPSASFGISVGGTDRMNAHMMAERACSARGQGCRVVAEFTAACGAVAHGILRSQHALFITSDPNSYVVTSASAGAGATQQAAEQQAMAECRSKDPRATCRITAATCGRAG
jgi:hypothetical protein